MSAAYWVGYGIGMLNGAYLVWAIGRWYRRKKVEAFWRKVGETQDQIQVAWLKIANEIAKARQN